MKLKDVHTIMDFSRFALKENVDGLKLDGMERSLNEREMLAIAYYQGVVRYLVKNGLIVDNSTLNVDFIEPVSTPQEDDYLV